MYTKPNPPEKYLKSILLFFAIAGLIAIGLVVESRINYYEVPDSALKVRLDLNKSGYVNRYDKIYTIVKIDIPKSGLRDLTGIEYCTILETLYIQDNNITTLQPLEKLSLKHINIANNPIDDISVLLEMGELEEVTLSSGNIPQDQINALKYNDIPVIILDGKLLE